MGKWKTMNILIVTAQPYLPQMRGGLQTSSTTLAQQFIKKGHRVALLAALMPNGYVGIKSRLEIKLLKHKAALDRDCGYDVWRAWHPWESLEWVAQRAMPDLVIVLARQPVRMALEAQRLGLPVMFMLQDVRFDDHGGAFTDVGHITCVANSAFTAQKYKDVFGIDSIIIHPLIDPENFATETTRENITLINPHRDKGGDIAIAIAAACPEIPFSFVETWPLSKTERAALMAQITPLKNVTLLAPSEDMKKIYGKCRILLAPSRCEEAFGRVAVEAQFSGIPIVASNRGGLPEAVGAGGLLLDPDASIGKWIAAVKRLWSDPAYYTALSDAALAHANGPSLNIHALSDQWDRVIQQVAAHRDVDVTMIDAA